LVKATRGESLVIIYILRCYPNSIVNRLLFDSANYNYI